MQVGRAGQQEEPRARPCINMQHTCLSGKRGIGWMLFAFAKIKSNEMVYSVNV